MTIRAFPARVEHAHNKAARAFLLASEINKVLEKAGGSYVGHIAVGETQRLGAVTLGSSTIADPSPIDQTEGVVLLIDVPEKPDVDYRIGQKESRA